jgi:hypothetical protein
MVRYYAEHLSRLRAAVERSHTLATIGPWICEHTSLRGEPFSFLGHEFQNTIVSDPRRQKNIRKCAQVGLSELSARVTLAFANILDATTWIYTLPTATFAEAFVKTRIDPIIDTSKTLRDAIHRTNDNATMKQFGSSFIYFKGTVGQGAAISVPADGLVHDEVDFSDQMVMSSYESRLIHSPYKIKLKFSTPTVGGFGISAEFDTSQRFWNFVKCSHCTHWFLPSYFDHVQIPGFSGEKKEISKDKLPNLRWQEATLLCPSCGKEPDLGPAHRAWVCENPMEDHEAAGYQIQPFDAPTIITAPYLVEASTKYDRFVDFTNFALGLPAQDQETSFTHEDLERMKVSGKPDGFYMHVMGIDMGLTCHIVVLGCDPFDRCVAVHFEQVPLSRVFERKRELQLEYRTGVTVMDSQPYADMLMRMQATDPNLYGAVYVTSKDLAVYSVKKTEEDEKALDGEKKSGQGEERERQVNVNRNRAFDGLLEAARRGLVGLTDGPYWDTVGKHLMDMKRVKEFTREKEVAYVWQKSAKAQDHFHHALLYGWVAAKMRGIAQSSIILPGYMRRFKPKVAV